MHTMCMLTHTIGTLCMQLRLHDHLKEATAALSRRGRRRRRAARCGQCGPQPLLVRSEIAVFAQAELEIVDELT